MGTIPVADSAKEALYLPIGYFRQFFRFTWEPVIVVFAAQVASTLLSQSRGNPVFNLLWWPVYIVAATPFSVSWTRLAVLGLESNVGRSWYTFRGREFRYLIVSLLVTAMVLGFPTIGFFVAYSLKGALPWIMAATLLFLELAVGIRFTFLLTSIALDSFQGLKQAWRQTKSVVLRIMAVIFLSNLPVNVASGIVRYLEGSLSEPTPLLALGLVDVFLLFLLAAVTIGAIAVCYRYTIEPEVPNFEKPLPAVASP